MQKLISQWMLVIILLLSTSLAHAEDMRLVLPEKLEGMPIGKHLEYLPDLKAELSFADLRQPSSELLFKPSLKDYPAYGYLTKGAVFWWKLKIENPSSQKRKLILVCRFAQTDDLIIAHQKADGTWDEVALGDQYPWQQKAIPSHFPVLVLELEPGVHEFQMRLKPTGAMQLPIVLWDYEAYFRHSIEENLWLGLFFGCCAVMLFYNLFVSIRFQSKAYFLYVGYIASYLVFALSFHGMTKQYFLPYSGSNWFLRQGYLFMVDMVTVTSLQFTLVFLRIEDFWPKMARLFNYITCIFGINALSHLAEVGISIRITVFGNLLMSFVLLTMGFVQLSKVRYARYFVLAWTMLLVGNVILILSNAGIISQSTLTYWGQSIGAAIELVFLSLALGDRMATINAERIAAIREQQVLQENLASTERARSVLQEELKQEAQFKVTMVSDLAHRINNPLNHVSISVSALDVEFKRLEEDIRALFEGQEEDPEVQDVLKTFEGKLSEGHRFVSIAGESAHKVAGFVKQIRSVSGVDGFAAQREDLRSVMDGALRRLYENVGMEWQGKLRWSCEIPENSFLMANHFALLLSFELVLRYWCQELKDGFSITPEWKIDQEQNETVFYLSLTGEYQLRGDIPEELSIQLKYLLKPYRLNPEWTPQRLSLRSYSQVIDPVKYPSAA